MAPQYNNNNGYRANNYNKNNSGYHGNNNNNYNMGGGNNYDKHSQQQSHPQGNVYGMTDDQPYNHEEERGSV